MNYKGFYKNIHQYFDRINTFSSRTTFFTLEIRIPLKGCVSVNVGLTNQNLLKHKNTLRANMGRYKIAYRKRRLFHTFIEFRFIEIMLWNERSLGFYDAGRHMAQSAGFTSYALLLSLQQLIIIILCDMKRCQRLHYNPLACCRMKPSPLKVYSSRLCAPYF